MRETMKNKVKKLKKEINFFTNLETKMEILKDSFKGEDCYVLSCGPSMSELPESEIRKHVSDKFVITIKQAYLKFGDLSSFQFFNCNNFTNYKNSESTIIVSQSDALPEEAARAHIWKNQEYDLNFLLKDNKIKENKLANKLSFDEWKFCNRLDRPWGPGLISETVFYFLEHLGVSKIKTIGWDHIDPKNLNRKQKHFYDNDNQVKKSDIQFKASETMHLELEESIELSKHTAKWFESLGVELEVLKSNKCFIHEDVKRFNF